MQLDLTFLRSDDRLLLSLRGKIDWLLTRSLVVRLVDAWIDKLQSTDLPDIGIPLGQRDIAAEHALSIEFDAPQRTDQASSPVSQALLVEEVRPIGRGLATLEPSVHLIGKPCSWSKSAARCSRLSRLNCTCVPILIHLVLWNPS